MIQVNLLPDVKREFIRARQLKRTVVSVSFLVSAIALGIFALFFVIVNVIQTTYLGYLDDSITKQTNQLKAMPDIAKILTIQNQLSALPNLHADKPVASRMYTYIKQLAPTEASIESLTVGFDETSMTIQGKAKDLASVNKFADTLKFTTYTAGSAKTSSRAFSDVVLAEFGVDQLSVTDGKTANYTITLKYIPEIFSAKTDVKLSVPQNKVTTRSETEKPVNIFGTDTQREGNQ